MKCKHCEFIDELSKDLIATPNEMTNREYWLLTEMFVYLHHGKDYCDYDEMKIKTIKENLKHWKQL